MSTHKSTYENRFSARLSSYQLQHIKAQAKPSCYLRDLIERDMPVVQNGKS